MHLSAACTGQENSPAAAAGKHCEMHSWVGMLQWASTCPLKSAPSQWGIWIPILYMVCLAHTSLLHKQHVNRLSSFCTAYPWAEHTQRDKQTHWHAEHTTGDICINKLHLCTECRWSDLKTYSLKRCVLPVNMGFPLSWLQNFPGHQKHFFQDAVVQ